MATRKAPRRATPAAADLEAELDRIASMNVDGLRALLRQQHGRESPAALSKDLLARALAYRVQERHLGGLDTACRRLLASMGREGSISTRWLKVGTVIVRAHAGVTHEVVVTPDGFLWRGQTYTSLSTIALRITGTSWNGARFFGLTGDVRPAAPVQRNGGEVATRGARVASGPESTPQPARQAKTTRGSKRTVLS